MKKQIFSNLQYIGNIYLEQELFDNFIEPIVFVSRNDNGDLFLCLCTETRGFQRWMLSKTSYKTLVNLLDRKIDTNQAIKSDNDIKYIIDYTSDNGFSINSIKLNDIDKMEFPSNGVYLDEDIWSEGVEEYLQHIKLLQKLDGDIILRRREFNINKNKSFSNSGLYINPNVESSLSNVYNKRKNSYQRIADTLLNSHRKSSPCKSTTIDSSGKSRKNHDITIDANKNIFPFAS